MAAPFLPSVRPYKKGEDFETWLKGMEYYCLAIGAVEPERKKGMLLHLLGPELQEVFENLPTPEAVDGENEYQKAVRQLKQYFKPKSNQVFEEVQFQTLNREPGEKMDTFIARLHSQVRKCSFQDKDIHVRNRLVAGCGYPRLQEKLLGIPDLTLEKATTMAILHEKAHEEVERLTGEGKQPEPMHHVTKTKWKKDENKHEAESCFRCGRSNHTADKCFYKTRQCYQCGKKGHARAVCTGPKKKPKTEEKKMNKVDETEEVYDMYHMVGRGHNSYQICVNLENRNVQMEVDTGAARSIMSHNDFCKLMGTQVTTEPSKVILRSYGGQELKVKGKVQVQVAFKEENKKLELLLVEGNGPPLLGRDWISALKVNLMELVNVIQTEVAEPPQLRDLMQKYADLFSEKPSTCKYEAKLQVDESVKPKFFKARPVPLAMKQLVEDEINRQVQKGVLKPITHSEWAAPVVTIVKPDKKSVRLCGSYDLTVNQASRLEQYPLPRTEELLTQLSGGRSFTKLDLKEAYLQLPLHEDSRKYMVVNTPKGLYAPTKLQYGVASAPAICQRYMENLLAGIPHTAVFLDDVCVTGENQEAHMRNLEEVMKRLHDAGLRLNRKKCSWFQKEVQYLGFKVDCEGIHPTEEKLKAVKEAPPPTNVKQLKSYLGLITYYLKFMKNMATVAEPLYRLLKKGQVWIWGQEQQESFQRTKDLLCAAPCLAHYNATAPLIVSADASPVGVGAVLSIVDDHGEERPVAYASRSLSSSEKNWSQLDREGLAIVFAVKKWHCFLLGRAGVTIKTDHRPLLALLGPDRQLPLMTSPRVIRWRTILSAYQYTLVYSPAHRQRNSDGLSRNPLPLEEDFQSPVPGETVMMLEMLETSLLKAEQVRKFTATDPVLGKVSKYVAQGWPDKVEDQLKPFRNRSMELSLEGGCLLWGNRVVIPEKLQQRLLQLLHDGHPGISAMKTTARSTVWWPGMDKAIETTASSCEKCQQRRGPAPPVEMRPWRYDERPWTRVHLDYAGPIEGKWILVIVDSTSKWIDAHVTSSTSTAATINKLRVTFSTHGLPLVLVTDNATTFTSEEFAAFLKANGVRHLRSPAYHPSSNGQAESGVKVIKEGLKKYARGTLEVRLTRILFKYRTTAHSTTRQTPAELLMGRRLRTHLDLVSPDLRGAVEIQQDQQVMRKKAQPRQFEVGDPVFVSEIGRDGPRWMAGEVTAVRSQLCEVRLCDGRIFTRHLDHIRSRESEESKKATDREDTTTDKANEEEEHRNRETSEKENDTSVERPTVADAEGPQSGASSSELPSVPTNERSSGDISTGVGGSAGEPGGQSPARTRVGGSAGDSGQSPARTRVRDYAGDSGPGGQSSAHAHRYGLRDRAGLRPPDRYGFR